MIQKRRRCLFLCPSWLYRLSHCLATQDRQRS